MLFGANIITISQFELIPSFWPLSVKCFDEMDFSPDSFFLLKFSNHFISPNRVPPRSIFAH